MDNRDPMERLSSAFRVEVAEDTKTRHIAEMGAALKTAPPTPVPTGFALRRRLAGALAAVFVVAAPVGMAVAAEDAVPGDVLYPMKQVTERVRAVFDDEVEATHRVEEVERLVFLRAPRAAITRAVERAESATSELAERDALGSRLEDARRRLQEQDEAERREREAAESQSREPDESSRQSDADRQGEAPGPGQQNGSGEPSDGAGSSTPTEPVSGASPGAGSEPGSSDSGGPAGEQGGGDAAGDGVQGGTEREGAQAGSDASPPSPSGDGSGQS